MTPTRDELIDLREGKKLTREKIAEHYDVSLTTVRRWIKELDIPRPTRVKIKRPPHISRNGYIIAILDDGYTVIERALRILGPRALEKRGRGYFLDGMPVSSLVIVHAAGLKTKDEK